MITGLGFITFQSALEDKAMILRKEGGGNNQTKACLIKEEVETCLKSGQFGCYFPLAIINTLWWIFAWHFGLRGRQEHHSKKTEDFTIRGDENATKESQELSKWVT